MAYRKEVNLIGGEIVWAKVFRGDVQIALRGFSYAVAAAFGRRVELWALNKCYLKANKWAEGIIEADKSADHF